MGHRPTRPWGLTRGADLQRARPSASPAHDQRQDGDQDGHWTVEGCPWLSVMAANRNGALNEARATIASWLDVEAISFEIEAYSTDT